MAVAKSIASRCQELLSRGWDLLDDCLSSEYALSLASECSQLEGNGGLRAHSFEFEGETQAFYEHPGRFFTDLPYEKALKLSEMATKVAPEVAKELQAKMPELQLTGKSQVKLLGKQLKPSFHSFFTSFGGFSRPFQGFLMRFKTVFKAFFGL